MGCEISNFVMPDRREATFWTDHGMVNGKVATADTCLWCIQEVSTIPET